jgi:hypothetical protein
MADQQTYFSDVTEEFCDFSDGFGGCALVFFDYFPAVSGDGIFHCGLLLICSILP